MTRPTIAQHRHALDVSVPSQGLTIDGDIDRIVQVLCNLLTNAAKYTPPGGHIALVTQPSDDHVVIACEDDGPGIPPDLAPKLFDSIPSPRGRGPHPEIGVLDIGLPGMDGSELALRLRAKHSGIRLIGLDRLRPDRRPRSRNHRRLRRALCKAGYDSGTARPHRRAQSGLKGRLLR